MGRADISQMDNPVINLNTIENVKDFILIYHSDDDTLFARPEPARPATSLDWDGELWVRVDPETGEILGLEIDDFETVFLKKHPDLAQAWQEVKPLCHQKRTKKYDDESWESFLRIIYEFLVCAWNC
jgi:hypothetical protein